MSRIGEIKEKLHQLLPTTPYVITDHKEESFKWASNYQSDIQYLLSRLEIAEKALEEAEEAMKGFDYNVHLERGRDMNEYIEDNSIIKVRKALQQLRA